jgi:hypothetical protein
MSQQREKPTIGQAFTTAEPAEKLLARIQSNGFPKSTPCPTSPARTMTTGGHKTSPVRNAIAIQAGAGFLCHLELLLANSS